MSGSVLLLIVFYLIAAASAAFLIFFVSSKLYYYNFCPMRDSSLNLVQIIRKRGFEAAEHSVLTEDGYFLVIHHLFDPGVDRRVRELKPVLMLHGMSANSAHFVINSKLARVNQLNRLNQRDQLLCDDSLAYSLALNGHDVWMANFRGNFYTLKHKKLNPSKDAKFWDFGLDEKMSYDMPAIMNYVRNQTKADKINVVGVSMGALLTFGLLSTNSHYNGKIGTIVAVSPAFVTKHCEAINKLGRFKGKFLAFFDWIARNYPASTYPGMLLNVGRTLNTNHPFMDAQNTACKFLCNRLGGQLYKKDLYEFLLAFPALHVSRKTVNHFLQMNSCEKLQRYDYGPKKNLQIYGQRRPPQLDMSKVTNDKVVLIHSHNDSFAASGNVQLLRDQLTNVPVTEIVLDDDANFDHFDFLLAEGCGEIVNKHVLEALEELTENNNDDYGLVDLQEKDKLRMTTLITRKVSIN